MRRTVVINAVGLTPALLGSDAPNLTRLASKGAVRPVRAVTPAVTCTMQSTFVTGLPPFGHGCVANGWYDRDLAEMMFWRQSNRLVAGEKLWETARRRDPAFTCAKLFWWYNMYAVVDWAVTPRLYRYSIHLTLPPLFRTYARTRGGVIRRLSSALSSPSSSVSLISAIRP